MLRSGVGVRRRIEPRVWLGSGALALGIGAAAFVGAGDAHAADDTASESSTSVEEAVDSTGSEPAGNATSDTPFGAVEGDGETAPVESVDVPAEDAATAEDATDDSAPTPVSDDVPELLAEPEAPQMEIPAIPPTADAPADDADGSVPASATVPSDTVRGPGAETGRALEVTPWEANGFAWTNSGSYRVPAISGLSSALGTGWISAMSEGADVPLPAPVTPTLLASPVATTTTSRPRHTGSNGAVFLGGTYLELGVSALGSFGSSGRPAGFYGPGSSIGLVADLDGFGTGDGNVLDFAVPDTPEERWSVGYNGSRYGGFSALNGNAGNAGLTGSTTTDLSTDTTLSAQTVSVVDGVLQVTQTHSFEPDDTAVKTTVTITNTSDQTLTDVTYMRSIDPDNTRAVGGSNSTINTIGGQYATDRFSMVSASSLPGDGYATATGHPAVMYYYSTDGRAKVYTGGFRNYNPYEYASGSQGTGYTTTSDDAIGIVFQVGDLAPGESVTFTYYTGVSAGVDPETIIDEVGVEPKRSPIRDFGFSAGDGPMQQVNAILRGSAFNDMINGVGNLAAIFGWGKIGNAADAIAIGLNLADGNVAGAFWQGLQAGGDLVMNAGSTLVKSGTAIGRFIGVPVFLGGAAVTTWSYVAEQATYTDWSSADDTFAYAQDHPGEAALAAAQAVGTVTADLGSAILGSWIRW
nr:hypothetical protein ISGA_1145 [Gordonia sp. NB41Y]